MDYNCCCVVGDRVIVFGSGEVPIEVHILELNPSLKMLCKLVVIQHGLEQIELTHDVRWELTAITRKKKEEKGIRATVVQLFGDNFLASDQP